MAMRKKSKPAGASAATAADSDNEKYVSIKKAADIVGVTPESIRLWIRRELLPAKKVRVVVYNSMVLKSALKTARTVTCRYCGKPFQAKRPQKARFCTAKHRDLWNYQLRKEEVLKAAKKDRRKAKR